MSTADIDPTTLDPQQFARMVKSTPAAELRRLMHSDRRTAVLNELFSRMPRVFRADRARTIDAVIHWNVGDRPGGGADRYEMVIANGTCVISPAASEEPKLTLTLGAVDFLNLVTGNAHAVALVMRGKLKTKGDVGLTAKFPTLFDVPRP
jgi:putative sterol carrier protein